jgi:peptidoglycan/xylan/chitin deacetylase (PgdA/CDA1 family)
MRAIGLPAIARSKFDWMPTVLAYHGVHDGSLSNELTSFNTKHVSADEFRRQLSWLDRKYDVVPLVEVEAALRSGRPRPRLAAITIDDGYENNLTVAWPILKSLGLPATVFITVDVIERQRPYDHDRVELALRCTDRSAVELASNGDRRVFKLDSAVARGQAIYSIKGWLSKLPGERAVDLRNQLMDQCWRDAYVQQHRIAYQPMTWDQVRQLADEGMEIASHTLTHPHLARISDDDVKRELGESRRFLEQRLERPVTRISYPHGSFDGRTERIAAESGYSSAFTSRPWFSGDTPSMYAIPRISVSAGAPFGIFVVSATRTLHMVGLGPGSGTES